MSRNNVKRSSSIRLWSYISAAHCICSSACCSFCSPLHLLLRLLQLNCPKSLFTFRLPGLSWFHSSVSFLCLLSLMTFLCCFAFGEKHAHISGVFITAVYKSLYCHYFANEKKNSKWKKKKTAPRLQDIFYQWQMQWSKLHSNTFLTPALHGWGVGVD